MCTAGSIGFQERLNSSICCIELDLFIYGSAVSLLLYTGFSNGSKKGLFFVALFFVVVHSCFCGFPCGLRALECGLCSSCETWDHSSWTRHRTHIPCNGRQIPNH